MKEIVIYILAFSIGFFIGYSLANTEGVQVETVEIEGNCAYIVDEESLQTVKRCFE